MDNNGILLALHQHGPVGLSYGDVRPLLPDLTNVFSYPSAVGVLGEHIFYLASNLVYARAKAARLQAELDALKGTAETDETLAYFTKPPMRAERRGAWHRDDLGAGPKE